MSSRFSPARRWLGGGVVAAALLAVACSTPEASSVPTSGGLRGPLCSELPSGSEPGGPLVLATESADVALTWIPVLTVFEAAGRATGLDEELAAAEGVTILAPSDGAFAEALSTSTLDELLLTRHDDLRTLLDAHLVDGELSLEDLLQAGQVTTRSGETIAVEPADGGMARLDGHVETVCADYDVANARIHVLGGVLGELPDPAATEEPHVG